VITLTLTLISTVTVTVSAHSLPIFDITTYGAISDNTTLCTSSIQAAIDAAYAIGGGIVFIPSGGAFWLRLFLLGWLFLAVIINLMDPMSCSDQFMKEFGRNLVFVITRCLVIFDSQLFQF
jgi:hypothetical protein